MGWWGRREVVGMRLDTTDLLPWQTPGKSAGLDASRQVVTMTREGRRPWRENFGSTDMMEFLNCFTSP